MINRYIRLIILTLLLSISKTTVYTQQQQTPNYRNWQDPKTGRLYWNKKIPAYLFIGTTPDSKTATMLKSESVPQYAQPFYLDTEGKNLIRTRWAVDSASKRPIVPQQEVLWEVYADGLSPVTKALFKQSGLSAEGVQLIGPESIIELTSNDASSGVETIRYSINGAHYSEYKSPLKPQIEGATLLMVYAEDRVGNIEEPKQYKIIVDLTPPVSSCQVTGVNLSNNTLAKSSTVTLKSTDKITQVQSIFYRIDNGQWIKYVQNSLIPIKKLNDGDHTIEFYATDLLGNKEEIQEFKFYLDATSPITISDILGDKFLVGDKMFFSGRTKMKITAVDNRSGVKEVLYSINNGEFIPYHAPFYMPNTQGWHTVRYYSIDSTENRTDNRMPNQAADFYEYRMKVDKVFVDLNGPSLKHTLEGPNYKRNDTLFVSTKSIVTLSGHDLESGLNYMAYAINGDAWEKRYEAPFDLHGLESGEHSIEYFGYDNVNNRNIGNFRFILDSDAPKVDYQLSVAPIATSKKTNNPVYPIDAMVFLTAQDNMTGVKKLEFSINGKPMREYTKPFGELERGVNRLRVRATDMVGNTTEVQLQFDCS